jgi:predicted HD superfamily hydrolase involved in NAD metabolism
MAVELAERFGVDVTAAELAGLLHDYARDEDPAGLVAAAEALAVPVMPIEREHPNLLHARVGAAMVRRDLPGLGEAVLSAIEVHTVGGMPMSDLDKVIYLADMIEPSRDFPGVEALRDACETEALGECFRRAYGATMRHLKERGRPVHPISDVVAAMIERETGRPLFDPTPTAVADVIAVVEEGAGVEDDVIAAPATHRRRRLSGRTHHVRVASARPETRPRAAGRRLPPALVRGTKTAGTVALIVAVLMGALWGLALGINSFARWNARRIAAAASPAVAASQNLLVIGVQDGTAMGFAAMKVERNNNRVLGIAIPDGAFVEVPGQGFERIGDSFSAGAAVSEAAVSNYFAVPFQKYVEVDQETYQALLQNQNIGAITGKIVATDLTASERASLTAFLQKVNVKDVWIVPLPVKAMTVGTERYFEPQRAQVADLLLQWWGVRVDQQESRPRVIVYNGVGTPGLASEAAQQLIRAGFRVVDSGNASHFGYTTTSILVYHAPTKAQSVHDALGVGTIQMQSAPQDLTDMIVIIGADYLPPVSASSTVPTEGTQ